jgi:NAD(P)-dependent dehydrogenase (short-subunit alcohol dehydrogenase family)
MTSGFADKVIAITGAGKGLGRAYAVNLANLGARIVVNNRRHAGEKSGSADLVVEEIVKNGGNAVAEYSSVEETGAGERILERALEAFGRLDALVANAGISEGRSFHKQNMDDFRRVVEINLMGTANVLQPAFRHMYEQRQGSVVVSTSVAGLYGEHGLPAYSASKAAVLGLMYSLSQEGAAHGVRVNALAPFAKTQMTEKDLPPGLGDRLQPEHVAGVLAWLISDQCSLTGETLVAGAGRISRARMMETSPRKLPAGLEGGGGEMKGLWAQLENLPLDQRHKSALQQFRHFISDGADAG